MACYGLFPKCREDLPPKQQGDTHWTCPKFVLRTESRLQSAILWPTSLDQLFFFNLFKEMS